MLVISNFPAHAHERGTPSLPSCHIWSEALILCQSATLEHTHARCPLAAARCGVLTRCEKATYEGSAASSLSSASLPSPSRGSLLRLSSAVSCKLEYPNLIELYPINIRINTPTQVFLDALRFFAFVFLFGKHHAHEHTRARGGRT